MLIFTDKLLIYKTAGKQGSDEGDDSEQNRGCGSGDSNSNKLCTIQDSGIFSDIYNGKTRRSEVYRVYAISGGDREISANWITYVITRCDGG